MATPKAVTVKKKAMKPTTKAMKRTKMQIVAAKKANNEGDEANNEGDEANNEGDEAIQAEMQIVAAKKANNEGDEANNEDDAMSDSPMVTDESGSVKSQTASLPEPDSATPIPSPVKAQQGKSSIITFPEVPMLRWRLKELAYAHQMVSNALDRARKVSHDAIAENLRLKMRVWQLESKRGK